MDRNLIAISYRDTAANVALLTEGVDRNLRRCWLIADAVSSPSSRRAWIEILLRWQRNKQNRRSPSSRRAWIEIPASQGAVKKKFVALLTEGVDRNK